MRTSINLLRAVIVPEIGSEGLNYNKLNGGDLLIQCSVQYIHQLGADPFNKSDVVESHVPLLQKTEFIGVFLHAFSLCKNSCSQMIAGSQ